MAVTLEQLAHHVGAEVRGDASCVIWSVATLHGAGAGQISFLSNSRYRKFLAETKATAVVLAEDEAQYCPVNALVAKNPYVAFARIVSFLNPRPRRPGGVHPTALIAPNCQIDASAAVGAHCVIEEGAVIGAGVQLGAGCSLGTGVVIGKDSELMANVTVYSGVRMGERVLIHSGAVIGSDGFGFANERGVWLKIPQIGGVIIGDDVEIGANTTIDRGALEDTVINDGVKIDNLVQIAHNVQIGAHTIIAGCVGVAGSARIGSYCALGGGVGVAGHLEICDNTTVTGMTLVSRSLTEPGVYSSGMPAMTNMKWNKTVARVRHLEDIADRLKGLEQHTDTKKV